MSMPQEERFTDRADAGRRLAVEIAAIGPDRPVIYALPRGGVPVALEISRALQAPLELIFVRKIGAPGAPELALGAVVDGNAPQTVINEEVRRHSQASDAFLERARDLELREIERRRARYTAGRPQIDAKGRVAIIADDGLATGATMKAALISMRKQGAAQVWIAVPVAPVEVLEEMRGLADRVICLRSERPFYGVGAFYDDFHQLTDEEVIGQLHQAWSAATSDAERVARRQVLIPPLGLAGELSVPADARGLVLFAHGSGSSRLSPRNRAVAEQLNARGFATLLFDLLTEAEALDRRNVFDIPLLSERILEAVLYVGGEPDVQDLPLGLFGASTGAGAALMAAAELGRRVGAVVSRGGRPDLAADRMTEVTAPTLLIVGGKDTEVIALNRQALGMLRSDKRLAIVPEAGHLFEEPGTLDMAIEHACRWFEHYLEAPAQPGPAPLPEPTSLVAALRRRVHLLPEPESPDFAEAFDRYGSARIVLLGEASHGTSEFYRARAAITRRLIEKHGFTLVALEADWPDVAALDRHIGHRPARLGGAPPFGRFPTWMWRNREVEDFIGFLRSHNTGLPDESRVRLFGLDLYSMNASIAAVLDYLDRVDPEAAQAARVRYSCFDRWSREPAAYGRVALSRGHALCEIPVTRNLVELLEKRLHYSAQDGDSFFDAAQNAHLVVDAERYYRLMYHGAQESWNLRDSHMFDTLRRILERAGPSGKAVVWAHNSHIGDARFTDMGAQRGELNIGQLCREAFGHEAVLIGFGTHAGTVAAASEWDAPMEIKTVRPSHPESCEALMHEIGHPRFLLPLGELDPMVRRKLSVPRLERYIGVIYRPDTERWSHYAHASLPDQYDAFVWFDETRAVEALPGAAGTGEDETFPFGL